ncbi:carboxymuconolactone decarboxylase family protein [Lactobacillus sp.]|uniref:carboxymuconolactone decarboxylase family protein n=1 Tax=Lactobacillus sp. TaxID=1591 RepID=UPI003F0473B0
MAKIIQTAGRDQLGDFAPEFAHFNDDVLFGENWNNQDIDPKTRSIVVISVFMGRGLVDESLKYHLQTAKKNGVTKKEIAAIITHAAFYAGWPVAWAVFNMAKDIWTEDEAADLSKEAYEKTIFFPIGEPNDAYAKYFIGNSYLAPVTDAPFPIHNVTFEPGCRNNWHIHHADKGGGQVLICVGGEGWCQIEGQAPVKMTPGKAVIVPANTKHWHGAAKDSWFSHLAFMIPGENMSNEWLEPVDDEEYGKL